jgi:hypothetical protein
MDTKRRRHCKQPVSPSGCRFILAYSVTKPTTIFFLDLHDLAEVLKLAKEMAVRTGREIEVRDSDSDLIETVSPTKH